MQKSGFQCDPNIPDAVTVEEVACPLGCASTAEIVLRAYDYLHQVPGLYTLVKCTQCGLMRTNPRPTRDSIVLYYPKDYEPYRTSTIQGDTFLYSIKRIICKMLRYEPDAPPPIARGRMLEVGCASGRFMHFMARKGWHVEGVEMSETAAESARSYGYEVYTGFLEQMLDLPEKFDLIVAKQVLEHLHDPVSTLKKLRSWTKPNGWLLATIPNIDSLDFKLFKKYWFALQLPTHLFHYSETTITNVFNAAGWKVNKIYHFPSSLQFQRSLINWLKYGHRDTVVSRSLVKLLSAKGISYLFSGLTIVANLFGLKGQMRIWATPQQ